MNKDIEKRVYEEAYYMLKTRKPIRKIAILYDVSKSTVHKDLQERLKRLNPTLHKKIEEIFQIHIETRHIIGGQSTKVKYLKKRKTG